MENYTVIASEIGYFGTPHLRHMLTIESDDTVAAVDVIVPPCFRTANHARQFGHAGYGYTAAGEAVRVVIRNGKDCPPEVGDEFESRLVPRDDPYRERVPAGDVYAKRYHARARDLRNRALGAIRAAAVDVNGS